MKQIFIMAATAVLTTAGLAVAGDRHHHHHHFGFHYHRSHGVHYGLHSYHHGHHHYRSGFGLGLFLGRSYRYYGYGYPRSYRYSYPYSYRYYRSPSYRSYSYSYPSCVVQTTRVAPRRPSYEPLTDPRKKRKVEPAPQPVAPPRPHPNSGSFENGRRETNSVASVRNVRHSSRQSQEQTKNQADVSPKITAIGPQFSIPKVRSLLSDDSIPFVVPPNDDGPVAVEDSKPVLPPLPSPPVVYKTKRVSFPE